MILNLLGKVGSRQIKVPEMLGSLIVKNQESNRNKLKLTNFLEMLNFCYLLSNTKVKPFMEKSRQQQLSAITRNLTRLQTAISIAKKELYDIKKRKTGAPVYTEKSILERLKKFEEKRSELIGQRDELISKKSK